MMFRSISRSRSISYFSRFTLGMALVIVLFGYQQLQAQTFSVLYNFTYFTGSGDGQQPLGTLTLDSAGNLYGTTIGGGAANFGTVFELDSAGTETVLYSFTGGVDGASPAAGLVRDTAGNLYGTTEAGGTGVCGGSACGTVFVVDSAEHESVLHSFTGGSDGDSPAAPLLGGPGGILYGTTPHDQTLSTGAVFAVSRNGRSRVLYSFHLGSDGSASRGGLIRDPAGNLYGTTTFGGAFSTFGTVFKLDSSGTETILYSFRGDRDGGVPYGGLVADAAGNFYGTTSIGGDLTCNAPHGCGTVFKLDSAGHESVLHAFAAADGELPIAGLVRDPSGRLYGTTSQGGDLTCVPPGGCGTVFELDPGGIFTVLHTFTGADGVEPWGGLVRDAAGNLYGTTVSGGTYDDGVVFEIVP
jgi:uncharacterized repeat protein (TIGR03803 family)